MEMAGGKNNLELLLVPSFDWTLNIVVVTSKEIDKICASYQSDCRYRLKTECFNVLFVRDQKTESLSHGVTVSSWVKGDPQVVATRVTYDYVSAYKSTYGSGYGSRPRSMCMDSVNSYRDKRFTSRAHPSPLIYDGDIGKHQYFSAAKQRSCLLQMKLESILHSLTHDVGCVAERLNPYMMLAASGLATMLMATTGKSLFAFWNGLHVDSCDIISTSMKTSLFPKPEQDWQEKLLNFGEVSFPTTLGYQHVWKHEGDKGKYKVLHHFVMPGMGLAMNLEDSICHHYMCGAFKHCTGLCVLEDMTENASYPVVVNNKDDFFQIFAYGRAANKKTARGNLGQENSLRDHRARQAVNRSRTATEATGAGFAASQGSGSQAHGLRTGEGGWSSASQGSAGFAASQGGGSGCVAAGARTPQGGLTNGVEESISRAVAASTPYQESEDDEYSGGIVYEDEDYEVNEPDDKKMRGKQYVVGCCTAVLYHVLLLTLMLAK
jgi:hypothetical protein